MWTIVIKMAPWRGQSFIHSPIIGEGQHFSRLPVRHFQRPNVSGTWNVEFPETYSWLFWGAWVGVPPLHKPNITYSLYRWGYLHVWWKLHISNPEFLDSYGNGMGPPKMGFLHFRHQRNVWWFNSLDIVRCDFRLLNGHRPLRRCGCRPLGAPVFCQVGIPPKMVAFRLKGNRRPAFHSAILVGEVWCIYIVYIYIYIWFFIILSGWFILAFICFYHLLFGHDQEKQELSFSQSAKSRHIS